MTTFSYAQLEQLWINNGGPKALAPVAAAIAEAESRGNSQAENPTDNNGTQTSWGLWQISNGTHGQPVPNILDPNVNAQQAVAKYRSDGNTFGDWGTYQSGAYANYLSPGTTPDPNIPQATLTSATGGGSDCLIGPFPHTSWCILDKSEARAMIGGLVVVGGLLISAVGLALVAVFALQRSGVAQTIVNLTPAGRVASAVKPAS